MELWNVYAWNYSDGRARKVANEVSYEEAKLIYDSYMLRGMDWDAYMIRSEEDDGFFI